MDSLKPQSPKISNEDRTPLTDALLELPATDGHTGAGNSQAQGRSHYKPRIKRSCEWVKQRFEVTDKKGALYAPLND